MLMALLKSRDESAAAWLWSKKRIRSLVSSLRRYLFNINSKDGTKHSSLAHKRDYLIVKIDDLFSIQL